MTLPAADYCALTPYLIPPGLPKVVNVGDGFILDSCEKLIGARASAYFSLRAELGDEAIARINASRFLLVAGSNILNDKFQLTPGLTAENLDRIRVPIAMMGLGHYGVEQVTQGMQPPAKALMGALLERFPYLSVRCHRSRDYVLAGMPELKDKVLLTSCPVSYSVDSIDHGFNRKEQYECMVVSITDRVLQQLQSQAPLLEQAAGAFPAKRRVLALHQNYGWPVLRQYAAKHGYEVLDSPRYEDFLDLYLRADLHVGNRVHGHLKALSAGAASCLLPYDLRQAYFAESLDFPLIRQLPSAEFSQYDFGRFTRRRAEMKPAMETFVTAVKSLL